MNPHAVHHIRYLVDYSVYYSQRCGAGLLNACAALHLESLLFVASVLAAFTPDEHAFPMVMLSVRLQYMH